MLTASFARVLGPGHAAQVSRVLTTDPVASCMVAARFEQVGMNEAAMGGQFWGVAGGRDGLLFAGASMVPLAGDAAAMRSFAHVAARRGRKCATILGSADLVLPLWDRLESRWGPARDVRDDQPLMACPGQPIGPLDPHVRAVRPEELDAYFPSAVSMFTEEVGVDPRTGDNGRGYRARIAELIGSGRAYARFDGKSVMFKAEIGSLSRTVALIQGVWVHPQLRGRGLAGPAMASVVRAIQRDMGRRPSLYVNQYNRPARRTYDRIGFQQVGTFASVLF
ncbi:MAG TPA: GNAT family N-acetyltransferase [Nakamurella sp.]|nr:GNAT family N-acetyltransferase [Nakamurella sp.]